MTILINWAKRTIILLGVIMVVLLVGYCVLLVYSELCLEPYPYCMEKIELTYLGSADGECPYFKDENGQADPEQWKERKFVYNYCQSYICVRSEERMKSFSEECNLIYNFDFTFKEGHNYICAYGYPLKSLRYDKRTITHDARYYNRAKLDKAQYKEGEWFIYEIDDIDIGNMFEERELVGWKYMY